MSSLTYAGIGSRQTPPDVLRRMTRYAQRLQELGWVLRSGGAAGADTTFQAKNSDLLSAASCGVRIDVGFSRK
jgi:predicted Rossmann fold nucleotide-binding protein DprA/Smf involved in DNA uptake